MTVTRVPISDLGAATLPLTGTELVPLVQGGVTRQAPVSAFGGGGVAAAALLAGVNNNLVVAGLDAAARLALTLAGDADLTGIAGGTDGKRLMIVNRSAAFVLTLMSNITSVAANRFVSNGDIIVPPLCGAEYIYDGTNQRWVKT